MTPPGSGRRPRPNLPGRGSILDDMFSKPGADAEPEPEPAPAAPAEPEATEVQPDAVEEQPPVQPDPEPAPPALRVKAGKAAAAKRAAAGVTPRARPRVPSKSAARSSTNPGGRQTQTTGNTRQTFFMGADAAQALHDEADRIVSALNGLVYKGTVLDALVDAAVAAGDEVLDDLRKQLLSGLSED